MACNFSFLIWPAGSAPAALARLLFWPSGAPNHCKNRDTVNRDFPTFSRACIFFLLTFSPLWSSHFFSSPLWLFPPLLFHLSILSEVWLLNFLRLLPLLPLILWLRLPLIDRFVMINSSNGSNWSLYYYQWYRIRRWRKFQNTEPIGEVGCCESRMQSESADGLKSGWKCVFRSGCNGCSGHLTHNCWM